MYNPSDFQLAVHDFSANGSGNGIIHGVAGCGKSTTIKQDIHRLPSAYQRSGLVSYMAFGNRMVKEITADLPSWCDCTTVHKQGFGALRAKFGRIYLDKQKDGAIATQVVEDAGYEVDRDTNNLGWFMMITVQQAVSLCKMTLTDPTYTAAFELMCQYYDVEEIEGLQDLTILAYDKHIATWKRGITFDDMVFLPVYLNIELPRVERLYVDECQDLNKVAHSLIAKMLDQNSRATFVGDRAQSIMGFTGSDPKSFDSISSDFRCTELPLDICYRCPTTHLDMARKYVPHIQPRTDAPMGEIETFDLSRLSDFAHPLTNDLVICRKRRPLFSAAMKLMAQGIPAKVVGGDAVRSLVNLTAKIMGGRKSKVPWNTFGIKLEDYKEFELNRFKNFKSKSYAQEAAELLVDKTASLDLLYTSAWMAGIRNMKDFRAWALALYSEDSKEGVVSLSTIHRAKGLEANRVFVIETASKAKEGAQDWIQEQERNLHYVSLTRSKQLLGFVTDDDEGDEN